MCVQFILRASARKLTAKYGIRIPPELDESGWSTPVLPYGKAPVMIQEGGERKFQMMQFSLLPSWSKDRRVKFTTHNARLEGIESKPTWRKPFAERHCIVPITHFIEPAYEGELAGHMVSFHRRDDDLLTAAGLWDEWIDPKTGEIIRSFTIITHAPPPIMDPIMERIGQDRCPVFLDEDQTPGALDAWLEPRREPVSEIKRWLLSHQNAPELDVEADRPLKPGWEKRR